MLRILLKSIKNFEEIAPSFAIVVEFRNYLLLIKKGEDYESCYFGRRFRHTNF